MAVLPPEIIITGVLSRLPVKSLLRFRCVSKPWCAEIDSPYFINLHLNKSTATESNLSLFTSRFIPNGDRFILSSIKSDSIFTDVDIPFTHSEYRIRVSGSSNDLLLLQPDAFRTSFVLFNPSTRKHLVLPDFPEPIRFCSIHNHCFLVYDAMNDDYKVFGILLKVSSNWWDERITWITTETRVYSLKSNSWLTIKNFEDSVMNSENYGGFAYFNGALHSINEIRDPVNSKVIVGREIIAIDIESGARHVMPMPKSMCKYDIWYMTDTLVGGCLCVIHESIRLCATTSVDIWVMKEYGVRVSWSMLISVVFTEFCRFRGDLIFYYKSCNEVLLHLDDSNGEQLVWCDLQTGTTRNFLTRGFPFLPQQEVYLCVESLVPVHIL